MQSIQNKEYIICTLFGLVVLLLMQGCDKNKVSKPEKINVLNALVSHYKTFDDSIAVFHESYQYDTGDINFAGYKDSDYFREAFSSISKEDMEAWQKQFHEIQTVEWKKWGWKAPSFITEKEYPKSFDYEGPPPPGVTIETSLTVYFFSIPLISSKHAFVEVAYKSGKYNWSVDIVLLEKTNEGWKVQSKSNISTT